MALFSMVKLSVQLIKATKKRKFNPFKALARELNY